MTTPDKLINVALGEVGYLEKASNAQLEGKTSNVGKANYTKYGAWYGINPGAWCAMFVSWCAMKAGASDIIPKFASCSLGIAAFKKLGRWHTRSGYEPKRGDIIFFGDKNGAPQHTGIVYKVSAARVYTIEGNSANGDKVIPNGGAVVLKDYTRDDPSILGYVNPDWPEEKTEVDKTDNKSTEEPEKSTLGEDKSTKELRFNRISEMPEWARNDMMSLCDKGILKGNGGEKDGNGRPADLDLSLDMIRVLVMCKRMHQ